jgi:hypothetical protein
LRRNILIIVVVALVIKLVYFSFAVGVFKFTDSKSFHVDYSGLISTLKKNDAFWYEKIALNGYPVIEDKHDLGYSEGSEFKQSKWAFFPFYPFLIKTLTNIPGVDTDLSFLLISLIFSLLGFLLFYVFLEGYFKKQGEALFITLLFIIFPFHYYFAVFYTEAIFFCFLMGSFVSVQRKKYWITSLLIIPLTLIRPNGVILLIPLYLFMLDAEGLLDHGFSLKKNFQKENIYRSLFFLSGPIAFFLFGFYQLDMTGEFFAFSIAQQGWYREFMFPLLALFREGNLANQFNSVYTILFILIAAFSWKKFPLSLNILIWLSLLLPLTSGSVQSMPRFISLIFPFSMLIGSWIYNWKWHNFALSALFLLQLFTYYFWLTDMPISF